jgi:hypothetical protein
VPQEPKYGFWYEANGEQPGHSLRDGGDSGSTITPEQIADEIERVDSDVADVQDAVDTLQARVLLLDHQELSGQATSGGTALTVPGAVQGLFWRYTLSVLAGADGGGTQPRPLVVRINGDSGDNYRYNGVTWTTSDGSAGTTEAELAGSLPRAGYVGALVTSIAEVTFVPITLGVTSSLVWHGNGWIHRGATSANNHVWKTGGRWNPSAAAVPVTFNIRTSNINDNWASGSHATLWGHL